VAWMAAPVRAKREVSRTSRERSTARRTGVPPRAKVRSWWVSPLARLSTEAALVM